MYTTAMQSEFEKEAALLNALAALRNAGRGIARRIGRSIKARDLRAQHSEAVKNVVPDPSPRNHYISRSTASQLEAPAPDVARPFGMPSRQQILKRQAMNQQEQFANMYPRLNHEINVNHLNWEGGPNNAGMTHFQGLKGEAPAPKPGVEAYRSLLDDMAKRRPRTGRHNY